MLLLPLPVLLVLLLLLPEQQLLLLSRRRRAGLLHLRLRRVPRRRRRRRRHRPRHHLGEGIAGKGVTTSAEGVTTADAAQAWKATIWLVGAGRRTPVPRKLGAGSNCSPRHKLPFDSRDEG